MLPALTALHSNTLKVSALMLALDTAFSLGLAPMLDALGKSSSTGIGLRYLAVEDLES